MLIHAEWCRPSSPNASKSPLSVQRSKMVSGVSSATGVFWNANRAIASIGMTKYRPTIAISPKRSALPRVTGGSRSAARRFARPITSTAASSSTTVQVTIA